ncbi:MAG: hypothetical protein H7Z38_15950 [Rubrivivax sp.]|nr:hypothetical protein [Pyrinomonadaceae bacterium]
MAYFEYHSTELRAETGEALVEAAASAKSGARIVIQVFSNDSTSNPLFYKSLQRQAGVVERELVALGISADNIATAGNSQRDQPPTPEPGSIVILAF